NALGDIPTNFVGGGGLGAGGDIFLQQGASLAIAGSNLEDGNVQGGASGGQSGLGLGSAIFLNGQTTGGSGAVQTLRLGTGQTAGQITTITGVIADEAGSVSGAKGAGALVIEGAGRVKLAPTGGAANNFTGGITLAGGTLELGADNAAGSGPILFSVGTTLQLDSKPVGARSFAAHLSGLDLALNHLDLRGLAPAGVTAFVTGSTLTVTNGTDSEAFTLDTPLSSSSLLAVPDGFGGTEIQFNQACFAEGTLITTAAGAVPVEHLAAGDLILTISGQYRPVRWIGTRAVDLARHPQPELAQPIRFRAGCIADGAPARDLFLSPDHAVFHDGRLIPARLLVNGASIMRETAWRRVTYYHVELDSHDVLFSEGLTTESYLDTGNRAMFSNGGGATVLHPDFAGGQAARVAQSYAPFTDDPAVLEPLWQQLATRATRLGWRLPEAPVTTSDPGLCIEAGGRRVAPLMDGDGRAVFVVPRGVRSVRLMSRAAVPGALQPWVADSRRLGVLVARLAWRRGTERVDVALDDPDLAEGWWAPEWHDARTLRRWTDGAAGLAVPGEGTWLLEVTVAATLDYPLVEAGMARRAA
ncbi:MAG: Hint domain-containing protein, partial [Proteobacteria bacterium]|nr:Hint domain-containing protein [Pseudomonadota bacterium]